MTMLPEQQCNLELNFFRAISRLHSEVAAPDITLIDHLLENFKELLAPDVPQLVELALVALARDLLRAPTNLIDDGTQGHDGRSQPASIYYGLPGRIMRRDGSLIDISAATLLEIIAWVEDHPTVTIISAALKFVIEDLEPFSRTGNETLRDLVATKLRFGPVTCCSKTLQ